VSTFDPQSYWDARHTRRYGPESVGYAGLGVPFNVWMYRVRAHVVERELRKSGIDVARSDVLDIGSGTGFYIALWERLRAKTITGSDFAPFAVRALKEKFPSHRFVELDITSDALPATLGEFDVISAFDIFYHIVDDARYEQAFRNIRSHLRPGGYFVFSENLMRDARETGEHQVSRTCAEITTLLEREGFEVLRRAPVFFLMNRPLKSSSRFLSASWRAIRRITSMHDRPQLSHWLGAALYPIELVSLPFVSRGPSTEMMICRAPA
jgi:SAM-dependent methyltransferase